MNFLGAEILSIFTAVGEEVGHRNAQSLGNSAQVEHGDITLAAFDGADESAVQAAALAQLSLGPAVPLPLTADAATEFAQKMLFVKVHP